MTPNKPGLLGRSWNDPLLKLELRTSTPYMPTSKNTAGIWAIGMLLLIIVCRLAFDESYTPEQIYALGIFVIWITTYSITLLRVITLPQNAFREWWLTLPVPRETLIRARMLGSLPLAGCFAAALWLIVTVHNALTATMTDSPLYAGADRIIGAAIAYAVLYAALTVLVTFVPTLIMTAMSGWRQWLLLLFLALWIFPTGSIGVLSMTQPGSPWMTTGHVWLYSACALLLIPFVYLLCLRLIPKFGFDWITAKRTIFGSSSLPAAFRSSGTKAQRTDARGFRCLYALERSAFRNISAIRWARLLYAVIVLAMIAGGYFSLPNDEWIEMIRAFLILPGIVTVTMFTIRFNFDINKRRLEWMLGFPYSRLTIMLSRLLAVWATSAIWIGGLAAGMTLGAAARYVFDRPEHFGSPNALQSAGYMIGLFIVFVIIGSLVSMLSYGYGNREWLGFVAAPLLMVSYMWPMLFNQFILPESLIQSGISESRWIWLALLAAIGLPLSWGAFILGSKGAAATLYLVQSKQHKRGIRTID